jgi:hypothetical protein
LGTSAYGERKEKPVNEHARRIRRPRCFLLYAVAPEQLPAAQANRILNESIGDPSLPRRSFTITSLASPAGW